jgi:hypothetical protein
MLRSTVLLMNYASKKRWFYHLSLRSNKTLTMSNGKGQYSEYIMQEFGESEYVCDVQWTKVVVEGVIQERIVDAEEDCALLWSGSPGEEG